jgi:predicted DNA-binding transcriptional regulator YafY
MASTKEAFVRYRIINECLLNKQLKFPSREEIKDKIKERLGLSSFSDRSFEKDLHDMRYDEELGFIAPIQYSKRNKGYEYTDKGFSIDNIPLSMEELSSIRAAAQVFEQYQNIPFLSQLKGNIAKLSDLLEATKSSKKDVQPNIMQFEQQNITKGGQYLGALYKAIQESQLIKIEYQKFDKNKSKKYLIAPYILKEYSGMWYVLAKIEETEDTWRTFALDRIISLKVKDTYFVKDDSEIAENFFNNVIGVSYSENKPQKIKIKIGGILKNHIQVNPIHHSQKTISESKDHIMIELFVVPNDELYAKLAQYLPEVSITSSKTAHKKFQKLIKEGLNFQ